MEFYRIYFLSPANRIVGKSEGYYPSDEDARAAAQQDLQSCAGAEVWQRARLVGRIAQHA